MKSSASYLIPGLKQFDNLIAEAFEVSVSEMYAADRKGPGKDARFFAMWYLKRNSTKSLAQIGRIFCNRDHATVLHACKKVDIWMENDKAFKSKAEKALELIESIKVNRYE